MKKRVYFFALTALLWSCQSQENSETGANGKSLIKGLASPILLGVDTSEIRLLDYFSDTKGITQITIKGEALSWDSATGLATLLHGIPDPLSNLRVVKDGIQHDIPVFASYKTQHTLVYKDTSTSISELAITGNMNGWNPSAGKCTKSGEGWEITWWLNPGVYQYQLVVNGEWKLDDTNPNQIPNGQGGMNSSFTVGEPTRKAPFLFTNEVVENKISLKAEGAIQGTHAYWNNQLIESKWDGTELSVQIPDQAKAFDRSYIRVFAHDGILRSNDLLIPLEKGKVLKEASAVNRHDYQNNIMYFMMIDRFVDGDSVNNKPTLNDSIHFKANNQGGDLSGITSKVKDDYLKSLGINTLWISPITKNAEGAWGLWTKGVTSKFSGYHGYWPTGLRQVDHRFGKSDDLKQLLNAAHSQDMNVVLDFVAHHVHKDHPLFQQHPDWVTELHLPDGRLNTELWDEHRLTTWFDIFLPTWDFSRPEVREALADSAIFWLKEYDLDGFRHDATKHVPEEFWRKLTARIKSEVDRPVYQIGETYGNPELIGSYVNSGQMDGQFDFNLYDAAVDAFANDNRSFENLSRVLGESLQYYGSHNLMGNITGNQDRARFASYADGSVSFSEDAKLAGWTRDIQNNGDKGFRKMEALMAFIMTIPGVPCIYYGDEIAMPGGNDPDNRRMMIFEDLNKNQLKTREITTQLTKLRSSHLALLFGDTYILKSDQNDFVYARKYFDDVVITWFHKSGAAISSIELPEFLVSTGLKAQFGKSITLNGSTITVEFETDGFEVITR